MVHRYIGIALAVFLLISAVTGVLLGWKKHSDFLQPPTQKGISQESEKFKSISELSNIANEAMSLGGQDGGAIDRMDFRPSKGMVKVIFEKGNWEVQVDASNGEILSIAQRHSDWIESLHDGSIISDFFKFVSMNILGFGLLILTLAGFWLWLGPKRIRSIRKGARSD